MGFDSVINDILAIKDKEELREINRVVIGQIQELNRREGSSLKLSLKVGQSVKLKDEDVSGKGDRLYGEVGKVVKLNPSKCKVNFNEKGLWTIPYNMLETVED